MTQYDAARAFQPIHQALKEIRRLGRFTFAYGLGAGLCEFLRRIRHRANESGDDSTPASSELLKFESLLQEASRDMTKDGPYVYSLAVVKLSSIIEVAVEDLAVAMLCVHAPCRQTSAVKKLKGSMVEFLLMDQEEQSRHLLNALASDTKSNLNQGLAKFECILVALGLGGQTDEDVRREIHRLLATRNVHVHRAGRADKQFITACPWVGLEEGAEVLVDFFDWHRYASACSWYLWELVRRVAIATTAGDPTNAEAERQNALRRYNEPRGNQEAIMSYYLEL